MTDAGPHLRPTLLVVRPPICEICDARFDPANGAGDLVRFLPDDRSREWRQRAAAQPGFVGHPPDTGWFCDTHIDRARSLAETCSLPEALLRLRSSVDPHAPGLADPTPPTDWDLGGRRARVVADAMLEFLPELCEAAGLDVPVLEPSTTDRRWHPMDGAEPPYCPFVDTTTHRGTASGSAIEVTVTTAHWSDDEVSNASISCSIGTGLVIRAFSETNDGDRLHTLRLTSPSTPAVADAAAQLAAYVARTTDAG